ncbi:MAG: hypothetical protein CMJ49_00115 [Planctomycetaceae bacterium]|nr:hypothetical protein [Planctomycetaceae bacterium]
MKDFRLALVAHQSPLGKTADNLDAVETWTRKAARRGAHLVALPELNITGHGGHVSMIEPAQTLPDGPACQRLIQLAAELNVYISAGIAERDHPHIYNTQFVVGPTGFLGKQRKIHLSRDEYFLFRHGTDLPVIELPFVKLGTVICFDNHILELARCLALDGAELILAPHAGRFFSPYPRTPAARKRVVQKLKREWNLVQACRAYDNACYTAACNTVGRSAQSIKNVEANHAGSAMAWDPLGNIIGQTPTADFREQMLIVDLKAAALHKRRNDVCLPLRVRRPEVYTPLTRPTA